MGNLPYITLVVGLLISVPAAADDSKNTAPTARQMAHCMMARVKTPPHESYRTAFKACKEQFESASGEIQPPVNAMNNVDAADSPKP